MDDAVAIATNQARRHLVRGTFVLLQHVIVLNCVPSLAAEERFARQYIECGIKWMELQELLGVAAGGSHDPYHSTLHTTFDLWQSLHDM